MLRSPWRSQGLRWSSKAPGFHSRSDRSHQGEHRPPPAAPPRWSLRLRRHEAGRRIVPPPPTGGFPLSLPPSFTQGITSAGKTSTNSQQQQQQQNLSVTYLLLHPVVFVDGVLILGGCYPKEGGHPLAQVVAGCKRIRSNFSCHVSVDEERTASSSGYMTSHILVLIHCWAHKFWLCSINWLHLNLHRFAKYRRKKCSVSQSESMCEFGLSLVVSWLFLNYLNELSLSVSGVKRGEEETNC